MNNVLPSQAPSLLQTVRCQVAAGAPSTPGASPDQIGSSLIDAATGSGRIRSDCRR
jgi:hypothetical protein